MKMTKKDINQLIDLHRQKANLLVNFCESDISEQAMEKMQNDVDENIVKIVSKYKPV